VPPEIPIGTAWTLDALGNWDGFTDQGNSQSRDHNAANETGDITGDLDWVDPEYDTAGNLIFAPKPGAEAADDEAHLYVYDAWNHLVEVYEDADESGDLDTGEDTLVVTYEYDGQKRRIEANVAGESGLDTYYNTGWQVLEVHEDGDADHPLKQFVWDVRYVDAPVLRFHDGDTDGTMDDTLHYTTDANMNVTALVERRGTEGQRDRGTEAAWRLPAFATGTRARRPQPACGTRGVFMGHPFRIPQSAFRIRADGHQEDGLRGKTPLTRGRLWVSPELPTVGNRCPTGSCRRGSRTPGA